MKRSKASFIYGGRKNIFAEKYTSIYRYCRETNSSFLPDCQIHLYNFLHLWTFNRTPPIWWCCGRFLAHHKLDIENISSIKGMTSQEEEGLWPPTGDFWHFRYQFFHVFCNFFKLVWDYYISFKIFPEVHTIPLKYQIFFGCLH